LARYKETGGYWNIPYLPIDPKDIGRDYESVIRINSQSGKGGTAYILKQYYGLHIPKELHPEIGAVIQTATDVKGTEMTHTEVFQCIDREFISVQGPFGIDCFSIEPGILKDESPRKVKIKAGFRKYERTFEIEGSGNGLIDALTQALNACGTDFKIVTYHEHSLEEGSEAKAVAYIQIECQESQRFCGIGIDTDIAFASLKALISALNRSVKKP
jgi:2-isopropylmalate synthase